jgi:ribosomal protein S1
MAKTISNTSIDKAITKPSKGPEASFLFTIATEGETLTIDSLAVMRKMIDVVSYLEEVEDQDGQLVLSRKRAKHMRTWSKILKAEEEDIILEGLIKRRTKGGFVVEIDGIEAFLPGSNLVNPTKEPIEETKDSFVILKTDPAKNALIVGSSRLPKEELEVWTSLLNIK